MRLPEPASPRQSNQARRRSTVDTASISAKAHLHNPKSLSGMGAAHNLPPQQADECPTTRRLPPTENRVVRQHEARTNQVAYNPVFLARRFQFIGMPCSRCPAVAAVATRIVH